MMTRTTVPDAVLEAGGRITVLQMRTLSPGGQNFSTSDMERDMPCQQVTQPLHMPGSPLFLSATPGPTAFVVSLWGAEARDESYSNVSNVHWEKSWVVSPLHLGISEI